MILSGDCCYFDDSYFFWNQWKKVFQKKTKVWGQCWCIFGTFPKTSILKIYFRKNHKRKIVIFQESGLQKSSQNRCQNRFGKNNEKKLPRNRFGPPLWFPKVFQNRSEIAKKAMRNEACFATLWKSPGSRQKLAGRRTWRLSPWLLIWWGLLYLSISLSVYLLICPSSP